MHAFLSLAQALALALGQGEPAEPPAEPPAAAQEPAAPAAEPQGEPAATPAPPPRRPRPAAQPAEGDPAAAQPAPPPPAKPAEAERAQVGRAALAFFDALLAGDAGALSAACSERFSFDGDLRTGKDEVKRAWRAILSERDPAQRGALLDLELLTTPEATARLGPPPPRLASIAAVKGGWVAVANVSRRPVVLFLAREGGRFVAIGME